MDKQLETLIKQEEERQKETLQLIPSENIASKDVRQALSSMLVNKYSEGYIGRRYYQGNKIIDEIEQLAVERAKTLFNVPYANVQPYSGSPANAAVFMGLVDPGEKIMGLKLSGGGHLTHGHPRITFSGKYYKSVQYDVGEDGRINYEDLEKLAESERPKLIVAGTTAYPRILDFAKFRQIADKVGAYFLADVSHIAGLIVAGVHPSPVEYAHVVMATTHKTLRGPRGAMILITHEGLIKDPEMQKKIDSAVFPGLQGGPHDNTTAAIAVALEEAGTEKFKEYGRQVVANAKILSEELMKLGLKLTTDGTDNHLMVVDLRGTEVLGKEAAEMLEEAGMVVNYNTVPHDTNPPSSPSGIRLGTPAVTTRGMKEREMKLIAQWMAGVIFKKSDTVKTAQEVRNLCQKFPI